MRAAVSFLAGMLALSALSPNALAEGEIRRVEATPHHRILLDIGPVTAMLTPQEALEMRRGELMLRLDGGLDEGASPVMAVADEGQPVNFQVNVRIYDRTTGDLVLEPVPRITIRNEATGAVRRLAPVVAMQDLRLGPRDYHFGNNVYLPDGRYTVSVALGDETVVFPRLALEAVGTTT
jgi:hypothetical protein